MRDKYKEQESTVVRPATIDTIIGVNTVFEGVFTASSTMRVDGTFKGDIRSESSVIVGEEGKVEGTIKANEIFISGVVEGSIDIAEKTELSSTGKMVGDIDTKLLICAEGAQFDGNSKMAKKRNANNVSEISSSKNDGKMEKDNENKNEKTNKKATV